MRDVIGWEPWSAADSPTGAAGQREVIEALDETRSVVWLTGNGSGKTTACAALVCYFMSTRPCIVLTCAPTWKQVSKQVWPKVRSFHAQSTKPMPGKPDTFKWDLGPEWWAHGFSTDNEANFMGFHAATDKMGEAQDLFVIVDEAGGMQEYAYNAIRGFSTKGNVYVMYAGNGNCSDGTFRQILEADDPAPFARFLLSAYDCPNGENGTPTLIDPQWIKDRERELANGLITQDQFDIRVGGKLRASGSSLQLITHQMLNDAAECKPGENDEKHIGVDVSRHGHDLNVVTLTEGGIVKAVESWEERSDQMLVAVAKKVMMLAESWGVPRNLAHRIHIDIGMGAGVADRMREAAWIVDLVDFGSKAVGDWGGVVGRSQKFRNRKTELFWVGRVLLQRRLQCIPRKFRETWRQLQWMDYDFEERSDVLYVLPKKTLRKQRPEEDIKVSPDFADSWILSLSRATSGHGGIEFL